MATMERPARVVFAPVGSSGDVLPFLALGRRLRARGCEVFVVANAHYRERAEAEGLRFVEAGDEEEFRSVLDDPDLWHPRRGVAVMMRKVVLRLMRRIYRAAEELYVPGRTVLCGPAMALGLRLAEEKLGAPLTTVLLQPSMMRSFRFPPLLPGIPFRQSGPRFWNRFWYYLLDAAGLDRFLLRDLNLFRRELGLRPVRGVSVWWNSPRRIVGLFPSWFHPPEHELGDAFQAADFPLYDETDLALPPELEAFLDAGPPPLAATFGTVMCHSKELFAATLDAAARLKMRTLLLTRFPSQLPDPLPPGALHVPYAPLHAVLPRTAALVHHGGIGTFSQALRARKPQVIAPLGFDQFDNAARLLKLGLGGAAPRRGLSGAKLARTLSALFADAALPSRIDAYAARLDAVSGLETACEAILSACVERPATRAAG